MYFRISSSFSRWAPSPILGALFVEVLLCQSLSSLLNFLFLVKTKEAIPNDEERAGWSGKCYAWTNGVSGFLQFVVMPIAMKWVDPRYIWLVMPSAMILLCSEEGGKSSAPIRMGLWFDTLPFGTSLHNADAA